MKRYEIDATMEVSETGGFVEYSDVADLERHAGDLANALERVTAELNRFHLNEKKWIGNPFECPACRLIETAKNRVKGYRAFLAEEEK